jgi:hypothetical protein
MDAPRTAAHYEYDPHNPFAEYRMLNRRMDDEGTVYSFTVTTPDRTVFIPMNMRVTDKHYTLWGSTASIPTNMRVINELRGDVWCNVCPRDNPTNSA